jgi:serine/threonine protein kinase
MEFVEGSELSELIYEKGKMAIEEVKLIIFQLLEALDYLHGIQIVHRDIKLDNILLRKNETKIKLVDFNVSRRLENG